MAEDLLSQIFQSAVQEILSPGWPEGRNGSGFSAGRSAYAVGCLCENLDG